MFLKKFKLATAFLGAALCFTSVANAAAPTTLVLTGDSTVTGQHAKYSQAGWGWGIQDYAGADLKIVNEAISGRSSRSYRAEGHWERAMSHHPDWVIIQFGHNDMKGKGPLLESDPQTDFRDHLRQYITEARAQGAKPILVTPVSRRIFQNGKLRVLLAKHAEATRAVAKETGVPCLDLHAYSMRTFSQMGAEASAAFAPPDAPKDWTHFSETGAKIVASWVLALLQQEVPELAAAFTIPAELPPLLPDGAQKTSPEAADKKLNLDLTTLPRIFEDDFTTQSNAIKWVMQGDGVASRSDWGLILSSPATQAANNYFSYKLKQELPADFVAQLEVQSLSPFGLNALLCGVGSSVSAAAALPPGDGRAATKFSIIPFFGNISAQDNPFVNNAAVTNWLARNWESPLGILPGSYALHTLTLVKNKDNITLYVDGVESTTTTFSEDSADDTLFALLQTASGIVRYRNLSIYDLSAAAR